MRLASGLKGVFDAREERACEMRIGEAYKTDGRFCCEGRVCGVRTGEAYA